MRIISLAFYLMLVFFTCGMSASRVVQIMFGGLSDGTISGNVADNKYLVQQKTLLDFVNDPVNGDYAVTSYTYLADGRPEKITDPAGVIQEIVYDKYDYPVKYYQYRTGSAANENLVRNCLNNALGQVLLEIDAQGRRTENYYDGHGRRYAQTVCEELELLTQDLYDPNSSNNLPGYIAPLPEALYLTGYDNCDRVTCQLLPDYNNDGLWGHHYQGYNRAGQVVEKIYFEEYGQYVENFGWVYYIPRWKEEYEYDYAGRQERHYRGEVHWYYWTLMSNYEDISYYDNFGRLTYQAQSTYNYSGGPAVELAQGISYKYDDAGNKIYQWLYSRKEGSPENATAWSYDIFGRQISQTLDPTGPADPNNPNYLNLTSYYSYDNCDNLIKVTDAKGYITETGFDNANRKVEDYFAHVANESRVLSSKTEYYADNKVKRVTDFDRNGTTILKDIEYAYDSRGRLTDVFEDIDGVEVAQTSIYYNDYFDPNVPTVYQPEFSTQPFFTVRIDDGEGKTSWRKLDILGNLTEILYPSGLRQKMGYYWDGKLASRTYFNLDGSESEILYKYHSLGWLIEKEYPDGSYVKYDLDSFGRVFACQKFDSGDNGQGEYSFNYDVFDKIVGVRYPDNAVYGNSRRGDGQIDYSRITYDEVNDPNGVYRTYADFDWAGRQTTGFNFPDSSGWYAWLKYDGNGNLQQLDYMNGFGFNGETATTYGYNKDNQLNSITGDYYNLSGVTLDGLGRLKAGTETITPVSGTDIVNLLAFGYDRRGSLTSANIGSWSGSYGYKLDGNIENRTEAGLSEDFGYDFDGNGTDESNMLSEIAGNPVSWDKNGWLTSDGMHNFVYDYDGKMQVATSLIDSDITVTYQYDPMGNRVGRVETNSAGQIVSEKKYILDYSSKVPNILLEMQKVSGNWQISQKNYYYGNMLVMSTDGSNQNRRYYIHDRLGSVRVVTNRNISVLNNYTYSPFGEDLQSQTVETVVNNVRYAGYQYDNELSQYYVWARMYSPYMARFNGYDPVLGDFKEPLTLHQYLYCANDPVNHIDIDGREFNIASFSVSTGISTGIGGISGGVMWHKTGDVRYLLAGLASGAVSGLIGGGAAAISEAHWLVYYAGSAGGGIIGSATGRAITGDWQGFGVDAAITATLGGAFGVLGTLAPTDDVGLYMGLLMGDMDIIRTW